MAKPFQSALLATVALSLLAGCSTALPTGLHAKAAGGKLHAKLLSFDDVIAVIENRVIPVLPVVQAGMPAVMAAPTDVLAQRATENLYQLVVSKTVPDMDPVLDASMKEAAAADIPPALINTNPEVNAYVQGIADRLTKATGAPAFKTYVLNIDDWNAFNAGGNSLYVFTGLIKGLKDEAELAGVMGHEMTHGLKRHALQGVTGQLSQMAAKAWVAKAYPAPAADKQMATALMLSMTPAQRRDRDFVVGYLAGKVGKEEMTNVGFGLTNTLVSADISRHHEAEADQGGVRMMARANYDPVAIADAFDTLNQFPDGDLRYYDHPALGQRVGSIRFQIEQEGLAKAGQERAADRLAAIVKKLDGTPGGTVTQLPEKFKQFLCK